MKKIAVIQTADIHGKLHDFAYIAAYISRVRQENDAVLVVDCGDIFRGHILSEYSGGTAAAEILNTIGYSFMVYGNDEHFKGIPEARAMADRLNFPVLGALTRDHGERVFPPYGIAELAGVKIGVIGLESNLGHRPPMPHGNDAVHPFDEAARWCGELRAQGCDLVMVISHLGVDLTYGNSTQRLAARVPDLDLICDGHSHHPLPEGIRVGKTLITQPADHMASFVHTTILIDGDRKDISCRLIDMNQCKAEYTPNPAVQTILDREQARIQAATVVIGHTPYLLDGGRPQIRSRETNLGDIMCDAFRAKTGAEIAFCDGGTIRASIDPGDITTFDLESVFANGGDVYLAHCTGAWIRTQMEQNLAVYPEQFPGFRQIGGIKIVFDPNGEPCARIRSITLDSGAPLEDEKEYLVAGKFGHRPKVVPSLDAKPDMGPGPGPEQEDDGSEPGCAVVGKIGTNFDILAWYLQSPDCRLYDGSQGRFIEQA